MARKIDEETTKLMYRVMDGAVAIFDALAGVQAQTVTVWNQADSYPFHFIFIFMFILIFTFIICFII